MMDRNNAHVYLNTHEPQQINELRTRVLCRSSTHRHCLQVHGLQTPRTKENIVEMHLDSSATGVTGLSGHFVAFYTARSRSGLAASDAAFLAAAAALLAKASNSSSDDASFVFLSDLAFWFRNFFKSVLTLLAKALASSRSFRFLTICTSIVSR